jgi:allantoinase
MKLPSHGRYDYVPITKRPVYDWPEGKRLAVFFCSNIEFFAYRAGGGVDPSGYDRPQSQVNFAWRDYGNRVGIWHYFDLLDEFALPGSHNVNALALAACPDIVERITGRGDEFVAHGRTNAERQDGMWEEDEARLIADATGTITQLSGTRPEGWLGPGLAETRVTPDLLKEAGYSYVMDWPVDDQPIWMRTRAGPILSVPYPTELNDLPAMLSRHHTGRQFAQMVTDHDAWLLAPASARPQRPHRRNTNSAAVMISRPQKAKRSRRSGKRCATATPAEMAVIPPTISGMPSAQSTCPAPA